MDGCVLPCRVRYSVVRFSITSKRCFTMFDGVIKRRLHGFRSNGFLKKAIL